MDLLFFSVNLKKQSILFDLYEFFTGKQFKISLVTDFRLLAENNKLSGFKALIFGFNEVGAESIDYMEFSGINDLLSLENFIVKKFDHFSTIDQILRDNIFITIFKPKLEANFNTLEIISKREVFLENELKLNADYLEAIIIGF